MMKTIKYRYFQLTLLSMVTFQLNGQLLDLNLHPTEQYIFEIDSQNYQLELYFKNDLPDYYSCAIVTEVCEDKVCQMAEITLKWDLTGAFLDFELPEGKQLTKSDHTPFSDSDYEKLREILSNEYSALANYTIKHIVREISDKNEVDAITTATVVDIKDEVVSGAAYSTFTFWHIVNGQLSSEIEKITKENISNEVLLKMLHSEQENYKKWGIDYLIDNHLYDSCFYQVIFHLFVHESSYLSRRITKLLSEEELIQQPLIQTNIFYAYQQVEYEKKQMLLRSMRNLYALEEHLYISWIQAIRKENEVLNNSFLNIVENQSLEYDFVQDYLIDLLHHQSTFLSKRARILLEQLDPMPKKVKKALG